MKENNSHPEGAAEQYADGLATQFRKGFLVYCVLVICSREPQYSNMIIARLREANMSVVEGTIYPLMNRLQKDGVLTYEWHESASGPPRKYYLLSDFGRDVAASLKRQIHDLNRTLTKLDKGASS